jgi:hypothetical protein
MPKKETWHWPEIAALVVSVVALAFSGYQAYDGHQVRVEAKAAAERARKDAEEAYKEQRADFERSLGLQTANANQSAKLAAKSASAAERIAEIASISNRLHLRPVLKAQGHLYADGTRVPHLVIANDGGVEAVNVTVEFVFLGLVDKGSGPFVGAEVGGTELLWQFAVIEPLQRRLIEVPERRLNNSVVFARKDSRQVLEVRVTYMRNPDRQTYFGRAFFFKANNGRWIGENSVNDDKELIALRKAVIKYLPHLMNYSGDIPFHELSPGQYQSLRDEAK